MCRRAFLVTLTLTLGLGGLVHAGCSHPPAAPAGPDVTEETRCPAAGPPAGTVCVLLFNKTSGFRHDSIATAITAVQALEGANGLLTDATKDAARFTPEALQRYGAVVFLMTSGDVLDAAQQAAFEAYIRGGGGYAGVHSAADTEYDWPWYGALVGAYFQGHPPVTQATVRVEGNDHPSTAELPATFPHVDEWYNFRANPRASVQVLATVDESTYRGGTMGADHPITWARAHEGGRAWYTAMGHTRGSYAEPIFMKHLLGGIRWAAGAAP